MILHQVLYSFATRNVCPWFFLKLRVVARVQRNPEKRPGGDAAAAPAAGPPKKWDAKELHWKKRGCHRSHRSHEIRLNSIEIPSEDIRRHTKTYEDMKLLEMTRIRRQRLSLQLLHSFVKPCKVVA